MKLRGLVWSLVVFVLGLLVGNNLGTVKAQGDIQTAQAWEIITNGNGKNFYVIKHNNLTGETWVLSAEGGAEDDSWLLLPEKDKRIKVAPRKKEGTR